MRSRQIFTIGHSTRSLEEFIALLKFYRIELVIDVRRFPSSRKFPWFNRENLEKNLPKVGIDYLHYPQLGGYRKGGYEAFTKTKEFDDAITKLIEIIDKKIAAILCAESLWWRCHRRYIANKLVELGCPVTHIFTQKRTQEHKLRSPEIEEKMKLVVWCDKKAKKFK